MPQTLTVGVTTIEDQCLWLRAVKTPVQENQPVGGIWEQVATIDDRSPAFYYAIEARCFVIKSCGDAVKKYIDGLRDALGEGPFTVAFTGTTTSRNCPLCRWAATPEPSDSQERYDEFSLQFISYTKPT